MQRKESKQDNYRQKIQDIMSRQSSKKKLVDRIMTAFAIICVVFALIPLASILIEVVKNGISAISIEFLTEPPGSFFLGHGGIGPAIQGTLIVVGLASLIGAPVGVLAGIYLSEYAGNGIFPTVVRFFNDVMTGLPSIVMGIVGYVTLVLLLGSFSVWAGAFALSIIMIPIIVRVTEESFKIVPNSIREGAQSLGIQKWKIILFITMKSAKSGMFTGIVLAISRIAGETAPLIMTILGTSLFFRGFSGPIDALPLRIWRLASQPYESAHSQGWGAALVLILIILILSVLLRLVIQSKAQFKFNKTTTF
jgi:phosphate transport system permease protein